MTLAVSGDGQTIASTLMNGLDSDNAVTVFTRNTDPAGSSAAIWQTANSLSSPLPESTNFGSSLEFSGDGSRLFIGADGGGPVFVY